MGSVVEFSEAYRTRPVTYRPAGDVATVIILPIVRIERNPDEPSGEQPPRRRRKLENRTKTKP